MAEKIVPIEFKILILTINEALQKQITSALAGHENYKILFASNFDDALAMIVKQPIHLVIAHNNLEYLHAIDLLAVVGRIMPQLPFIILDKDLSPKTAIAAFRLGAVDYLVEPLNFDLLLMQIERALLKGNPLVAAAQSPSNPSGRDYSAAIDPARRAVTFVLSRNQYQQINTILSQLRDQVGATFAGLLDSDDNITAASGTLGEINLKHLKSALATDHHLGDDLASVLGIDAFTANYFEGIRNSVYIMEMRHEQKASLVVICSNDIKSGVAWLQTKRAARDIEAIIFKPQSAVPRLAFAT